MKRFPVGLTLAATVGLAVLLGLGAWQLWWRLPWKQDLLARIAALQHAPARPIGDVLARAARGEDVGFVRVAASCAPAGPAGPAIYRYALRDGRVGWRLLGFCALPGSNFGGIVLDRGLVDRFSGQMAPAATSFPPAVEVTGVLRATGGRTFLDPAPSRQADGSTVLQAVDGSALALVAGRPAAPYYLAVESERPAPTGLTPAPLPQDIPNNHLAYALTWFALAGILVWMWAGFVMRRMRGT
jgi:surfeit locus 1 family protein